MTSHYVQNKIPSPLSLLSIYVPATSFLSLSAPAPLTSRHSPNHRRPSLTLGCLHHAGACAGSLVAGHLHHSRRPSTSPDVHTHPHPRCEVYRLSSAKIYLEVMASGRSKTHHVLALSADFLTPKEPFCTCVVSPESRGRGWGSGRERGDHLILYPNRIFPLFVPAMAVILRCLQEIKPGCLPCLSCYFYFRWQTGG